MNKHYLMAIAAPNISEKFSRNPNWRLDEAGERKDLLLT